MSRSGPFPQPTGRIVRPDWKAQHKLEFHAPKTSPWLVPLPDGAWPLLFKGFSPTCMEERYIIWTDPPSPSSDNLALMHVHRSWTGYPLAAVAIRVPTFFSAGEPDGGEGSGAMFTAITYESSQERWDAEAIGLADLRTAKGFVLNVLGGWVFEIRFPRPIWREVAEDFERAKQDLYLRWEKEEEEMEKKKKEKEKEAAGEQGGE